MKEGARGGISRKRWRPNDVGRLGLQLADLSVDSQLDRITGGSQGFHDLHRRRDVGHSVGFLDMDIGAARIEDTDGRKFGVRGCLRCPGKRVLHSPAHEADRGRLRDVGGVFHVTANVCVSVTGTAGILQDAHVT
ncbi:hypothetical protein [Bradyrhizobium sp. CSA112]|uniref:hypothetical protein n=1 Tax=Bradyrhizobium sp. CSA112 TaxID=2699170 RepID=UPI0023B1FB6A|nr:hypothetical protein [Bradyrhizobium sp. CSA112]